MPLLRHLQHVCPFSFPLLSGPAFSQFLALGCPAVPPVRGCGARPAGCCLGWFGARRARSRLRAGVVPCARPALSGWLGHESPFAFDLAYRPGHGIERMRVGTPPILQLAALEAALDIWDNVSLKDLRAASLALQDRFIAAVEASCPGLALATPRDHGLRGSQVSFRHPQGYAIMQALIGLEDNVECICLFLFDAVEDILQ